MMRAASLIAGPILVAALVFQLRAPGGGPGVYVEVESRGLTKTYALMGRPLQSDGRAPAAVADAPLFVDSSVISFLIVDPEPEVFAGGMPPPQLGVVVVNSADASFQADMLTMPATITRVNPRVYQVMSTELGAKGQASDYYRRVVASAPGDRAMMDLVAGLIVQDARGRRFYSLSLGRGR